MPEKEIRELHKQLSKNTNLNKSYDDFVKDMQDEKNVASLYKSLKENTDLDVSYGKFVEDMSLKKKVPTGQESMWASDLQSSDTPSSSQSQQPVRNPLDVQSIEKSLASKSTTDPLTEDEEMYLQSQRVGQSWENAKQDLGYISPSDKDHFNDRLEKRKQQLNSAIDKNKERVGRLGANAPLSEDEFRQNLINSSKELGVSPNMHVINEAVDLSEYFKPKMGAIEETARHGGSAFVRTFGDILAAPTTTTAAGIAITKPFWSIGMKRRGATQEEIDMTQDALVLAAGISSNYNTASDVYDYADKIIENTPEYEMDLFESFKNENYGDFYRQMSVTTAKSIPFLASTFLTRGSNLATLGTIGSMGYLNRYNELYRDQENSLSNSEMQLNSLAYGVFEGLGEVATAGIMNRTFGPAFKSSIKNMVSQSSGASIKQYAKDMGRGVFDVFALEPLSEALVTNTGQNLIDNLTGVDPERGLFDNFANTYIGGIGVGATIKGAGVASSASRLISKRVGNAMAKPDKKQKILDNYADIARIEGTKKGMTEKSLKNAEATQKKLLEETHKLIEENDNLVPDMTFVDAKEVIDADRSIEEAELKKKDAKDEDKSAYDRQIENAKETIENIRKKYEAKPEAKEDTGKEGRQEASAVTLDTTPTPRPLQRILKTGEDSKTSTIKKGDNEAGTVTVDENWNIKRIDIEPNFQRQGIAKDTYRELNQQATKEGTLLKSDRPDKINSESKRIWESLVRSGEAEQLTDGSYQFKKQEAKQQNQETRQEPVKDSGAIPKSAFTKQFSVVEPVESIEGGKATKIGDTNVVFSETKDKINLESIRTEEGKRGEGSARKAMEKIVDAANKSEKDIELRIAPEDSSVSPERLETFYKEFGFEKQGDTYVRKYEDWFDKVDKSLLEFKKRFGSQPGTLGVNNIPAALVDGGVEVARKAFKATKSIKDAVDAFVGYMESKRELTAKDRSDIQRIAKEVFGEQGNVNLQNEGPVSKGEVAALGNKIKGIIRDNKIASDAKEKGVREGAAAQKKLTKEILQEVSDEMKALEGRLSPTVSKAIINKAKDLNFSNEQKVDEFITYVNEQVNKSNDRYHSDLIDDLSKYVRDQFNKKMKKKRPSGEVKSTNKALPRFKRMKEEGLFDKSIDQITEDLDGLISEMNEKAGDLSKEDLNTLAERIEEGVTALKAKKSISGAIEAKKDLKRMRDEGATAMKETLLKKHAETVKKNEILDRAARGNEPPMTSAQRKTYLQNRENSWFKRFNKDLGEFLDRNEAFRTLLDKIDRGERGERGNFDGVFDREVYMPFAKARNKHEKITVEKMNEFVSAAEKIFGKENLKTWYQKKTEQRLIGEFINADGLKDQIVMSEGEAMYVYMVSKTQDGRGEYYRHAWTDDMIDAVSNSVSPKAKQFADWMQNEYYPKYYTMINGVYENINYMPLNHIENYVPIRRMLYDERKAISLSGFQNNSVDIHYGFTKERSSSKSQINLKVDAVSLAYQQMGEMNHYVAFAEVFHDYSKIFNNGKIIDAIKTHNSNGTKQTIDRFLESFKKEGYASSESVKFVDKIRGWMTTSRLGINGPPIIKQLASFPAMATNMPSGEFVKGLGYFLENPIEAWKVVTDNPYIKIRMEQGFSRDTAVAMAKNYEEKFSKASNVPSKLMLGTRYGDVSAIVLGGYSVYRYHYDNLIKKGASPAEADDLAKFEMNEAVKLSQQDKNTESLSDFERGNGFQKLFTSFKTSQFMYFRQERKAIRDLMRGHNKRDAMKRFITYHFVLPTFFEYMTSWLPGIATEWEEDDTKDMIRAASIGSLNGIFLVSDAITFMADMIMDKPWTKGDGGSVVSIPAFDPLEDLITAIVRFKPNEDDFLESTIDLSIAALNFRGFPASTAEKYVKNYKLLMDETLDFSFGEGLGLALGWSPHEVIGEGFNNYVPGLSKNIIKDLMKRDISLGEAQRPKNAETKEQFQEYQHFYHSQLSAEIESRWDKLKDMDDEDLKSEITSLRRSVGTYAKRKAGIKDEKRRSKSSGRGTSRRSSGRGTGGRGTSR